jgi:hypothetical protein
VSIKKISQKNAAEMIEELFLVNFFFLKLECVKSKNKEKLHKRDEKIFVEFYFTRVRSLFESSRRVTMWRLTCEGFEEF